MSNTLKQDLSIGKNLRKLRKQAGYTQDQIATKLQTAGYPISREIVSQMELGKYSIRVGVLVELKELYRVSYDDFFTDL